MPKVYVLGTSKDINKLDKRFFAENETIGINGAYRAAETHNEQLTEWISHDQFYLFYPWIISNSMPLTRKWIYEWYVQDERLNKFNPKKTHHKKPEWSEHIVRFYDLQRHTTPKLAPVITNDKAVLDDYLFTIFTAISLAVGLGYSDIRLRGVSLKGDYFDSEIETNRDNYYYEIKMGFYKQICPALKKLGISIVNETEETELVIKDGDVII